MNSARSLIPSSADQLVAPPDFIRNRSNLHRLATYVIAPVRYAAAERFGLRSAPGGFGTPVFGADRRIRVEGANIIDERAGDRRSAPITTLRAAAEFLDTDIDEVTAAEHDTPPAGNPHEDLAVNPAAVEFLGTWFEVAFAALHAVRDDNESVDASEPQLWPGHFDAAIELGDENHRASYGASPGDDTIDEPYLYVSVWWPDQLTLDDSGFWNSETFTGRVLRLRDFPADADPVDAASAFWRTTRDHLDAS